MSQAAPRLPDYLGHILQRQVQRLAAGLKGGPPPV